MNENKNGLRLGRHFHMVWLLFGSFWGHSGGQFQCFSELWEVLGPSWDQLGSQRWILEPTWEANAAEGCFWGAWTTHFEAKGCPRNSQSREQ